jgi:hypothetical protein
MSLLVAAVVLASTASAQLSIVAIDPPLHASNRAPNVAIAVDFDRAVDPASLTAFSVYGAIGGPPAGTKVLENGGTRVRFTPARPWFAGEVVTVSMSNALRAVDGSFLRAAGHVASFRVRAAPAPMAFTQIQSFYTDPGNFTRICGGQHADYDGDDSIDLGIVSENSSDVRIFKNAGTARASSRRPPSPLTRRAARPARTRTPT